MTAGEFAFLALGLILGLASGAALVVVVRARPPSREIRLTVASDAVPRRLSATLASDAFTTEPAEPARGGPADRRAVDRPDPVGDPDFQAIAAAAWPSTPEAISARIGATEVTPPGPIDAIAIRVHSEPDPELAELSRVPVEAAATTTSSTVRPRAVLEPILTRSLPGPASDVPPRGAATGGGGLASGETASESPATAAAMPGAEPMGGSAATGSAGTTGHDDASPDRHVADATGELDPCANATARVEDQCRLAEVARLGATTAARAAADVRREYDDHRTRADHARAASEPRRIQQLKEEARTAFRSARASARDRATADAAATTWLTTVNEINTTAREAALTVSRSEAAANALLQTLERATAESDAARISAEAAEAGCLAAREELATCREAAAAAAAARAAAAAAPAPIIASPWAAEPVGTPAFGAAAADMAAADVADGDPVATAHEPAPTWPATTPAAEDDDGTTPDDAIEDVAQLAVTGARVPLAVADVPTIIPLVNGDPATRGRVAAALDASDAEGTRPWADLLDALVDAVAQRAIEETILDTPREHPFWAMFSPTEARDVLRALAALGFRFDGSGGWADGRMPSQRDLSLAVGYGGQDPMRIRQWPSEADMASLLAGIEVGAAEYLIGAGGDLGLGEIVDLLGPHADGLTDLWNAWGFARPILMAPAEISSSG